MPKLNTIDIAALVTVTGGQTKSAFTQKLNMRSVPWHQGNGKTTKSPTDFLCKPTAPGDKYRDCVATKDVGNASAEASSWHIPVGWGKTE